MTNTEPSPIEQAILRAEKETKAGNFFNAMRIYNFILEYEPENSIAISCLNKLQKKIPSTQVEPVQLTSPTQEQINSFSPT